MIEIECAGGEGEIKRLIESKRRRVHERKRGTPAVVCSLAVTMVFFGEILFLFSSFFSLFIFFFSVFFVLLFFCDDGGEGYVYCCWL